jgi:cyclopropane fatty-acyl-phospholipid synthase-like methyltransferase
MSLDAALFDELPHAGPEHLDPDAVSRYDEKAGFDADAQDEVRLLHELGVAEDGTLVDLGAGTGTLAVAAAASFRRVVAVDVSPAMVAATQAKVAARGLTNVECVAAGLLRYEHDGEPADAVYSRNALHHLPDFWKAFALARIASILRPGGMLRLRDIVFSFEPDEAERRLRDWFESPGAWSREELEAHVRDEHSTFTWLLEPMLEGAGFEIVDAAYDSRRVFARYVCRLGAR